MLTGSTPHLRGDCVLCYQSSAVVQTFLQGHKHTGSVQQEYVCAWVYCSPNINRQVRDSHQILVDIRSLQQVIQCGLGIQLYACFIGLTLAPPIPTIAAKHLINSEPDAQAFDVLSNAGHQTDLMPQEVHYGKLVALDCRRRWPGGPLLGMRRV